MKSDAPTRVLLLRHAETAAPHLFHGAESDVGLSERGRQQAEAIAPVLAAERPVAVISSPMRRAVETAEPIAWACGVELRIEPDFYERRIGALYGTPYNDQEGPWAETLRRGLAGSGTRQFWQAFRPDWDVLVAEHAADLAQGCFGRKKDRPARANHFEI